MVRRTVFALAVVAPGLFAQTPDPQLEKARQLAKDCIIVDTHIDVPYRLREHDEDVSVRTPDGNFDYVRAVEGGLDAPFMSIYVPSDKEDNGAKELADTLIDMVEKLAKAHPDKFALARTPAAVRAAVARKLIALPMGMENGSPINHDLKNLAYFAGRGINYITLAHAKSNHISNAAYDTLRPWPGLSPFGERVVAEMNRLGIMIDISHLSDDAAIRVLELTKAPVIASHSSCRSFTPGFERNMSDEIIKKLALNGGVIQIAFAPSFLSEAYREYEDNGRKEVMEHLRSQGWRFGDPQGQAYIKEYMALHPGPLVSVKDAADHIDHVVKLVGIEHVGIGSDFDGVGDALPKHLESVADYPNLIAELLKRGYSDDDVRKVCGENVLRVWERVEAVAQGMKKN